MVHTIMTVYSSSVEQNHLAKQAFENLKNIHIAHVGSYIDVWYYCIEACNTNTCLCKFTITSVYYYTGFLV